MSKISNEIEKSIISEYLAGEINKSKIASKFNINRSSVINILKRNKINIKKELIYSKEQVELYFIENGCKLLSGFTNVCKPMQYICQCGTLSSVNFNNFKKGTRCRDCMKNKLKTPKEKVFDFIRSRGHIVLSSEYINAHEKLSLICPNGHKVKMTYNSLKAGATCKICGHEKMRGENHPNWNPDRSYEKRAKERKTFESNQWRSLIFKRDHYICQRCNSKGSRKLGGLIAHHLNGFHWDEKNRLNIKNGVTLCSRCHSEFHAVYGNKDNTITQYNTWNNPNKILDDDLIDTARLYKSAPLNPSEPI